MTNMARNYSPHRIKNDGILYSMNMKEKIPKLALISATSCAMLVVIFLVGVRVGSSHSTTKVNKVANMTNVAVPKTISSDFGEFWQVWQLLDSKYPFEKPDNQEKVYSAIKGLVASYGDPFTMYFSPDEAKLFQQEIKGEFGGIGTEIESINGILTVITPLKGSPAERAGIKPRDIIAKIDGADSATITLQQALQKIRGKEGKAVTLTIVREGKPPFDVIITREIIRVPIVTEKQLDNGIYKIQLASFSTDSASLFKTALNNALKTNPKGLIIDLRGNPGGLLSSAIDIVSHFLPKGAVIVKEDFGGKRNNISHTSDGYGTVPKSLPVVILVDGGSASASEILAGALQENDRAKLVGTTTFGKGSVQELMEVGDGSAVKITIAQWLTPKDHQISKKGIEPDYKVEIDEAAYKKDKTDAQLNKAIELLNK